MKSKPKHEKQLKEGVHSKALEGLLEQERANINASMKGYLFQDGGKLEDHVYELGGNPVKALVGVPKINLKQNCIAVKPRTQLL